MVSARAGEACRPASLWMMPIWRPLHFLNHSVFVVSAESTLQKAMHQVHPSRIHHPNPVGLLTLNKVILSQAPSVKRLWAPLPSKGAEPKLTTEEE